MPTGKTPFRSSAFRLGLAMAALLCVAGAVLGVRYFAQAAPFITTDKDQYFSNEIATISGGGFAHNTLYDIPVIRPDGTIVKGDGSSTSGWDTVQSDASGAFTYHYQLDGISGTYTVRVYPYPWDGNRSQTPVATATFTDDNVKAKSGSSGVTFTLTATKYTSSTDCSGSGSTNIYTHVDWHGKNFGVGNLESVKLQAADTSDQGGAFINWTDGVPPDFTDLGGGVICVPGSSASGGRDYYANYGGTPTPVPATATHTPTPTDTSTPTSTATHTPTPTDTSTPTSTATHTPIPTDTSTPTSTATHTPIPTDTSTPTSTATYTPTATSTFTPTPTRTSTPTPTFTPVSPTPTRTSTPVAPTATLTPVPSTPHPGVGGAVLLPAAAVAARSGGTSGGSGQTVATWALLVIVAGALATGSLYARSRRRGR